MNSKASLVVLALLQIAIFANLAESALSEKPETPAVKTVGFNSNKKFFYKPVIKNGNATIGFIYARILEIGGDGNTKSDVHVSDILPNSDVIVGVDTSNSTKIVLECSAPFPVQWVYHGDGMPEFSSNTSVIWNTGTKIPVEFIATVALGFGRGLDGSDTGNYICKNTNNPQVSVFYYLYVPGKSLFIAKGGVVPFSIYDAVVRIPCSVTNPHALVTLQKSINGLLQCPLNDSIIFNTKSGFHMHVTEDDEKLEPGGHYVCTAGFNNSFQLIEFTLEANQPGAQSDEVQSGSVSLDSGEENNMGRSEYACDPNPCGSNSLCRTVPGHNFPHCTCEKGFSGRPPKCRREFDSICEPNPCGPNSVCRETPGRNYPRCSCLPGFIGRAPRCRPECNMHQDCAGDTMCIDNRCQNPCPGNCGEGATCSVEEHVVVCSCPPGYSGNPLEKCGRNRMPSIHYFPTIDEFQHEMRHPCEPWPCGPLSECKPVGNKAHCSCALGYVGQPPRCKPECRRDSECSNSFACIENRCRNPCSFVQLNCIKAGSKCLTKKHKADCYCPNFRGSFVPCSDVSGSDEEYTTAQPPPPKTVTTSTTTTTTVPSAIINYPAVPPQHQPIIGISGITGITEDVIHSPAKPSFLNKNPCQPSPCGINSRCTFKNQTVGCKCLVGFSGPGSDPYTKCNRDAASNPCEVCGPHSVCEEHPATGQSTCTCQPGKIGYPPYCRENYCVIDEDCPNDKACKAGYCVNPCEASNRCATNAECRTIRHTAVCACPNSPDSDPFLSCSLKGHKVPFGIE